MRVTTSETDSISIGYLERTRERLMHAPAYCTPSFCIKRIAGPYGLEVTIHHFLGTWGGAQVSNPNGRL